MTSEYTKILDLDHTEAQTCFLKDNSYCTFDLPRYFEFKNLLYKISDFLENEHLPDHYHPSVGPQQCEDVNYTLYNNKHGKYAWRPLELIHPVLYVDLVNKITKKENWNKLCDRLEEIRSKSCVECPSLPIDMPDDEGDDVEVVTNWWHEVEQRSIEHALGFNFIFHADISNCYNSIYTHSVCWAIHGKNHCKENRGEDIIGNMIDKSLQCMSYAQTNGIPQGSKIMDFIAEIILHYGDELLTSHLKKPDLLNDNFKIIRYRDDYRVFTKNTQDGQTILRKLTEVLAELGFNLNDSKTDWSDNVIKGSIKPDKLHWMQHTQRHKSSQKQLHVLKSLSEKYPNSGTLSKQLNDFYGSLKSKKDWDPEYDGSVIACISIVIEIGLENPRTYPMVVAIISRFMDYMNQKEEKRKVVKQIKMKTENMANTSQLLIWLQRITVKFDKDISYNVPLCKRVIDSDEKIWASNWVGSNALRLILDNAKIVNHDEIANLGPYIGQKEVSDFMTGYRP